MSRRALLPLVLLAFACTDPNRERTDVLGPPSAPETGVISWLALSGAADGDVVTVTARVTRGINVGPIGSFTARIAYDTIGLSFVGEAPLPGATRATNRLGSAVLAAGASVDGFIGDRLVALRFKVIRPSALESLELVVTELRGGDFSDLMPELAARSGTFEDSQPPTP